MPSDAPQPSTSTSATYVVRWDDAWGAAFLREFARPIAGWTRSRKHAYQFDRRTDAESVARKVGGVAEEV